MTQWFKAGEAVATQNFKAGLKFDHLTLLYVSKTCGRSVLWLCRCDCGREVVVSENRLKLKLAHSCPGCPQPPRKHGALPKNRSLLQFIAWRGGIKSSDSQIADLRQSIGGKNKFIPGFGQLIRTPKQLSLAAIKSKCGAAMAFDIAREAAIEAAYLTEEATLADLLEAMDCELRGERIYPRGYIPEGYSVVFSFGKAKAIRISDAEALDDGRWSCKQTDSPDIFAEPFPELPDSMRALMGMPFEQLFQSLKGGRS